MRPISVKSDFASASLNLSARSFMESGTFIVSNISDGDGPVYPPPLPLPDPLPPFEPVSSLEVNTFSSSKPKIVFFSFFAASLVLFSPFDAFLLVSAMDAP